MSIRITQGMIYDKYVSQMQSSLGAYMESSEQGSTQKKINRPSDDPAGIYKVLTLRKSTSFNTQLLSNCDTAKGWLKLEDSILSTQMPTVVTSIKALAEQASTGTYSPEQRRSIGFQVRQQFGSLLNMANSEFDGNSLFAGHKYDSPAYRQGLALLSKNSDIADVIAEGGSSVTGESDTTIAFQLIDGGSLDAPQRFRWTTDGGEIWKEGTSTVNGDTTTFDFVGDGVTVTLANTKDGNVLSLNAPTHDGVSSNDDTIYIRPAAFYMGDVNDDLEVTYMGVGSGDQEEAKTYVTATAAGPFSGNVLVRMDSFVDTNGGAAENIPATTAGTLKWSYSTDNGMNWVAAEATLTQAVDTFTLPLPEGNVKLTLSKDVPQGTQLLIHPEDANLEYEIMKDTYITVNGVGKDIFGGYYEGKPAMQEYDDPARNLFEVVGNFIAYLETNNQDGCQETLAKLAKAEEHLLTQATRVGGLENRVDIAYDVLTSQKLDIKERLSYVEDIDLTDLLVKLQQQQITYQTVLQSASKIMNMSLANYL